MIIISKSKTEDILKSKIEANIFKDIFISTPLSIKTISKKGSDLGLTLLNLKCEKYGNHITDYQNSKNKFVSVNFSIGIILIEANQDYSNSKLIINNIEKEYNLKYLKISNIKKLKQNKLLSLYDPIWILEFINSDGHELTIILPHWFALYLDERKYEKK